ncbi:MAG: leucine-rich repeat domain-containing protein [Clostridia bacterium]|nr:leucine-rich repeat domain-containing protein [Clostridia bacterium]
MKKINQVLSIILAILMVMSTIPITATAATATYSDVCGKNLIWTLDESTGTLTISGTGDMYDGEFSYPSWNANLVESVIISEGVTSIGELAFCYNTNIKNVSIADSVTDIGDEAFYNCTGLTDIVIGEGVTNIGYRSFYNCTGLTNIVIGTGVTSIGEFAFQKCSNLETVTIYNAVEEICEYAFNWCSKLTDVYYFGTESEWNAIKKATLLSKTGLENATIHFLGEETHECSYNAVVTPPTCTEQGYTTYTCICGDSYIDNYVDATGHSDNDDNGLCDDCGEVVNKLSGTYGENLTWSFDEITGTLTIFGEGAMDDDVYNYYGLPWKDFKYEIVNVVISDGVTSIGLGAFELCINVKNITIPDSVTIIGEWAFSNCDHITKVVIPEGVEEIGEGAFNHCDYLDTVVIPGNVKVLGDRVFGDCKKLANVTLGEGITNLGLYTFDDCINLTDIVIPESVTSLRGMNFAGCTNLKSITIPATLTGIGYGTFGDCINLQDVYYNGTEEDFLDIEAYGKNAPLFAATLHCESSNHTHNYVKVGEVAKTCEVDGYTQYACICGRSYKGDYVEALGHVYDDGVVTKNPTCDATGVKTFTCSVCGEGKYTEAIPKKGHNYDDGVVTTEPTCTTNGIKTFTCSNCGDKYTESIDKLTEHNYELIINLTPSETECVKNYKCTVCGDTYTETVNASGHTKVIVSEIAPTETQPGLTAGVYCSACDAVLLEQQIIPALGTTDDASNISSGTCGTKATWTFNKETGALTISGTGAMTAYKYNQAPQWDYLKSKIKSIVIKDGITAIGDYAFKGYTNLMYVSISDTVTQIGANAFAGCSSLVHITLSGNIYFIYASAFEGCSKLNSVTIGSNLMIINNKAFKDCNALTDVFYVGTEEQWNAISIVETGNSSIANAKVHYNTTEKQHYYTVFELEPTCTEAGYTKFVCECGDEYTVNYPALGHNLVETPVILPTTESVGYTKGEKCTYCNMVTDEPVEVPAIKEGVIAGDGGGNIIWTYNEVTETMEFFGELGFDYYDAIQDTTADSDERPWGVYGCSRIQYVIVHEGITGINDETFYGFRSLRLISLPSTLQWICSDAFRNTGKFATKYNGTEEEWKKIDGYYINDNMYFNGSGDVVFSGTHGDNLTWIFDESNSTLTISGKGAMESSLEYPWSLYAASIENVVIKSGVTSIASNAFKTDAATPYNIKNVEIADTVTKIGNQAFANCDYLTSVTIPVSVTTIYSTSFYNCDGLKDVYYLGTEKQWNKLSIAVVAGAVFNNATIHFIIYEGFCGDNLTWMFDGTTLIISGTGDMYDFDVDFGGFPLSPWGDFIDDIECVIIGDGVTSIGDSAFLYCNNLKSVKLGSGLTKIVDDAFYWCSALTDITFPESLTEIGRYAFYQCENLSSVVIPLSVQKIDYGAFQSCTNLKDVYYEGTEEQWKSILIGRSNRPLLNATIHYNYGKTFTGVKGDYFYIDDVRQKAYQLVEFEGDFYFINDSHKIAKNKTLYLSDRFVNGFTYEDGTPLQPGYYTFDETGKMVILNGPVGDYFYENNVRLKAYQLVEFEGDFYFINDSHKIAKNKTLYLSDRFVNGFTYEDGTPLQPGYYTFDETGKMVILNGPVGDYFYENNVRLKAYQLVEFEGNYYFINDSHKLAKNKRLYMSQRFVEGTDLEIGYYEFDENGRMIKE